MSREAQQAPESRTTERGAERVGSVAAERGASLSRDTWASMEVSGKKANEPASGSLNFEHDSLYGKNQQYASLSLTSTSDAGSTTPDRVIGKSSEKVKGGGHVDHTDLLSGTGETTTYDKQNHVTKNRIDRPDGSFNEQSIDKNNDVKIREQKANGDFTETTLTHDNKITSRSRQTNADGGHTDASVGPDGKTESKTYTKDNHLVGTKKENPDGSYTERKVNPDNSITFHDQKNDGSFVETRTDKNGTSRTVHAVDETGGSTTQTFDPKGNLIVDRITQKDGRYFETTKNSDGTTTEHNQKTNGDFTERTTNDKGELVSPQLDGKGTASPEFVQKVREQIASLPANERKLLADGGTHVVATGMILDAHPEWTGQTPRGHRPGKTWNDLDGAAPNNELIIAERTNAGLSNRTEGAFKHEAGHQVDRILGMESDKPEFIAAYNKDVAAMNKDQKSRDEYELQDGHAGRSEAFAEAFGAINGSSANKSETGQVLQDFPNVAEYIRKRMNGLP